MNSKVRFVAVFVMIFAGLSMSGQINMTDSTVQVVAYWVPGEKHDYSFMVEKISLKGLDTTDHAQLFYDAEMTVIEEDEDDGSYTVKWIYKNITTNNQQLDEDRLLGIAKESRLIYKTDELGVFWELVNWKELRDIMFNQLSKMKKDPNRNTDADKAVDRVIQIFTTREAIETVAIKDILMWHTFHGLAYKLGDTLQERIEVPNIYGTGLIEANYCISLDSIDVAHDRYTLSVSQIIDPVQLTNASYLHLVNMAQELGQEPPTLEELDEISSSTHITATLNVDGWVISIVMEKLTNTGEFSILERMVVRK